MGGGGWGGAGSHWSVVSRRERDNNVPFVAKVVHMLYIRHQDAEWG